MNHPIKSKIISLGRGIYKRNKNSTKLEDDASSHSKGENTNKNELSHFSTDQGVVGNEKNESKRDYPRQEEKDESKENCLKPMAEEEKVAICIPNNDHASSSDEIENRALVRVLRANRPFSSSTILRHSNEKYQHHNIIWHPEHKALRKECVDAETDSTEQRKIISKTATSSANDTQFGFYCTRKIINPCYFHFCNARENQNQGTDVSQYLSNFRHVLSNLATPHKLDNFLNGHRLLLRLRRDVEGDNTKKERSNAIREERNSAATDGSSKENHVLGLSEEKKDEMIRESDRDKVADATYLIREIESMDRCCDPILGCDSNDYDVSETYNENIYTSSCANSFSPFKERTSSDNVALKCSRTGRMHICVTVYNIVFSTHPGFNEEETIYHQLRLIYSQYLSLSLKENNKSMSTHSILNKCMADAHRLLHDVQSNRKKLTNGGGSNRYCDFFDTAIQNSKSLRKLFDDIMDTASQLIDEENQAKNVCLALRNKWDALRDVRLKQGFVCTPGILHVEKTGKNNGEFDPDADELSSTGGKQRIELDAIIEQLENLLPGLHNTLTMADNLDRKALKSKNESASDWKRMEQCENEKFDVTLERLRALKRIQRLKCKLKVSSKNITPKESIDQYEKMRRKQIVSEEYYVRLLVNGHVVDTTNAIYLSWPNFSLTLKQKFHCRMTRVPRIVCVQIVKRRLRGLLPDRFICSNFVQIGEHRCEELSTETPGPTLSWYQFTSMQKNNNQQLKSIRGSVLVGVQWGETNDENECSTGGDHTTRPGEKTYIPMKLSTLDERKKNEFQQDFQATGKELMLAFKVPGTKSVFKNYHVVEEPMRHVLIKLRETHLYSVPSPIPIHERFVREDGQYQKLISEYKSKNENNKEMVEIAAGQRVAVDIQNIRNFVRRVQDSRNTMQQRKPKRQLSVSEIVKEYQRETVPSNFSNILKRIFPPRKRSLRPSIKTRIPEISHLRSCRLLVTIIGARNVPCRIAKDVGAQTLASPKRAKFDKGNSNRDTKRLDKENDYEQELSSDEVNAFVQVKFQDTICRTRQIMGVSPMWKQSLDIPIKTPDGEFSPTSFMQISESLNISLFDAVETDIRGRGGYYNDEDTIRKDMRFLGDISIPFSTIYTEGKIQEIFRLNSPALCFGYRKINEAETYLSDQAEHVSDNENRSSSDQKGGPSLSALAYTADSSTYLNILLTLEPLIQAPKKESSCSRMSKEDERLLKYINFWTRRMHNTISHTPRIYQVLVPDMHGYEWLITRFLKSQEPPPGFHSVHKCAHFVSLIPFLKDWQAFAGENDMWCTHQQFLDILAGDWEEHALLLAGYFMWLSVTYPDDFEADIYLVLGKGMPEGETLYVMQKSKTNGKIIFWDASTGLAYCQDDERCPLRSIFLLVTQKNVYANIQRHDMLPCFMDMNVNNRTAWRPFYSEQFPAPPTILPSVQEEKLNYSTPNKKLAAELEGELEATLKSSVRSWRRRSTSFKGDVSNRLRSLLDHFEMSKLKGKSISHDECLKLLETSIRGRKAFGIPLHVPFTEIADMIKRVNSTCVHQSRHPDVEFALAVRVYPYCNVMSVWVILCSLYPIL